MVVPPGEAATATLKLQRGVTVSGRVVDAATGAPLAGGRVLVSPVGEQGEARFYLYATTDADGRFRTHVPAGGRVQAWPQTPPAGYLQPDPPPGEEYARPPQAAADADITFPDIKLRKSVGLAGRVVDADGKPVAGAVVFTDASEPFGRDAIRSGPDGRFTVPGLDPDDEVRVWVRQADRVNVPQVAKVNAPEPLTIRLSEAAGMRLAGRVVDAAGAAVPGAAVEVQSLRRNAGRRSRMWTGGRQELLTADADGRFRSSNLWVGDSYKLQVSADGFASAEVEVRDGQPVPDVRLTRVTGSVRGMVVGLDGKPVAGATVFSKGDTDKTLEASSAADGTFTLTGYRDAPGFVQARKAGYRLGLLPADPNGPPVTLVLRTTAEPPAPAPDLTVHRAALDTLTREVLEKFWAERGEGVQKYGHLIGIAATFDPEMARRWAAEAKADPAKWLPAPDLLPLARTDPAAAVAQLPPDVAAAVKLARRLTNSHPQAAGVVLDEAVRRARAAKADQAVTLAECGWLALRLGRADQAKGLTAEAVTAAEALSADDRFTPYRLARAAGFIAAADPAASDRLLDKQKDETHDSGLLVAVDAVAAVDPKRAAGLLGRFRSNHFERHEARVFYACRVARTDPDGAKAAVAGIPMASYRALGFAKLATVTAAFDTRRAWGLIDAALADCSENAAAFRSSLSNGGAAGTAAAVAHHAARIGYPDVAAAVATAVALRPTADDVHGSATERERSLLPVVLTLSFTDPATARRVLDGAVPPAEQAKRFATGGREWIFAATLLDPAAAAGRVASRRAALRNLPNAPSHYGGFTELLQTLAARDRYAEAARWVSLPKFNNDWEE